MTDQAKDMPKVTDKRPAGTEDIAMTGTDGPNKSDGGTAAMERTKTDLLLSQQDTQELRRRWAAVQTEFVDEPRKSVEAADKLVAEVMQKIAQTFASEKGKLESQWNRGENISTEDLRVNLQRYRAFFDRLLSL